MLANPVWSASYATARPFADDASLVAALQRGDSDAVTHVVQQYGPVLYRYIYYQVQDAMLAELTPEQRQVILLHVVDGWELPEVARKLGRSVPSVKSLYYRGVQSLRRVLTREPRPRRPAA